jgi:hypothetical protein
MQPLKIKVLTLAMAAVLAVGTLDAAAARTKKHRVQADDGSAYSGSLVPMDKDGTPIIMQGYRSRSTTRDAGETQAPSQRRADRPVKIPRGSSTYIPPPVPSPYSANSPPAAALIQPPPAPYKPPPITTYSDRVNNAIQAFPLEKGLGNNSTDQQTFIRQQLTR